MFGLSLQCAKTVVLFFCFVFFCNAFRNNTISWQRQSWNVPKKKERKKPNLQQGSCMCPFHAWSAVSDCATSPCCSAAARAAAVIFISPIKNLFFFFTIFFGFTPFHPVIETSAFALISRPETAERVNQCPITRANRVKGGGGRRGGGGGGRDEDTARLSASLAPEPSQSAQSPSGW